MNINDEHPGQIAIPKGIYFQALKTLRELFVQAGFDLRLVGGCVRDLYCGLFPQDIDLCTDADPNEQREIYRAHHIRHIDTGLHHGTWLVMLGEAAFEITSLRNHDEDGEHYIKDWMLDLSRRDLTINAMGLDFDGVVYDPFNGRHDLDHKQIRFVGSAADRVKEDPHRILRWFRFQGRFKDRVSSLEDAREVFTPEMIDSLKSDARERVWSEMIKIMTGPHVMAILKLMIRMNVGPAISLPQGVGDGRSLYRAIRHRCPPHIIIAIYLGSTELIQTIARAWKWSLVEKKEALFVYEQAMVGEIDFAHACRLAACDLVPTPIIYQALLVRGLTKEAFTFKRWRVPIFPVKGADLVEIGYKESAEIGAMLLALKNTWRYSQYTCAKSTLIAIAANKLKKAR